MKDTSHEKVAEALKLLEEAAAEKKAGLRNALSGRYRHVRNAVVDATKHAVETAVRAREVGARRAREFAGGVDRTVRRHPWPCIAGMAAGGLMAGYVLARRRR